MTYGQELLDKIVHRKPKGIEWLELEKNVKDFLKSDEPEDEKNQIKNYSEMLYMICRGIEKQQAK